ncbi:hypothetical protein Q3G72_020826 [Acer saccharum]|nr:hypothetical protein Q3G72_020826 [Acer saccharum]
MSIVLQGKLCTFSSKDTGSTSNVSRESRKDLLKEGDFCGEELVNWVQDEPSSSRKLISNRTIKALTKVEALVLRTDDLKDIYNQKAKVIQAFLRKRRIMISRRNGQTTPGELTAPEIVVEGINSSVLEIVVESGVACDEDEDEEKGCREKQIKEASRLQTVNRKLSAMNKLLMVENDHLQKHVSHLVYENGYMRTQLQSASTTTIDNSCESVVMSGQHSQRDANNLAGGVAGRACGLVSPEPMKVHIL